MAPMARALATAVAALALAGSALRPAAGQEGACAAGQAGDSEQAGEACVLLQARQAAQQAPAPAPPAFIECTTPLVNTTIEGELRARAGCSLHGVTVVGNVVATASVAIAGGEITGDVVAWPNAEAAKPRSTQIVDVRIKGNILLQEGSGDLRLSGNFSVIGTVEMAGAGNADVSGGKMGAFKVKSSGRIAIGTTIITADIMVGGGVGGVFLNLVTASKASIQDIAGGVEVDGCTISEGLDVQHVTRDLVVVNSQLVDNVMTVLGVNGAVLLTDMSASAFSFSDVNSAVNMTGVKVSGNVAFTAVLAGVAATGSTFGGLSMVLDGTGSASFVSCVFGHDQTPADVTVKSTTGDVKFDRCGYLSPTIVDSAGVDMKGSRFWKVTISGTAGDVLLGGNHIDTLACSDNARVPVVPRSNKVKERHGQCQLPR